ncbi:MAG: hypothetical protein KC457_31605 [Myxococcales bacterium]|nr:hypothetical protein [Myxococcales bacterium]
MTHATQVLARVGSDGSYDLVVELLRPAPAELIVAIGEDGGAPPQRLEQVLAELRRNHGRDCVAHDVGLRLNLFRRLPDPFVITARVRAALALLPTTREGGSQP